MRRAMAADSSSGVPSLPETDRGDAAEARPRMGGATADKYGLKQLVLFHSKTHILEFVCFCYAAHMLCYAASVAIIQDVRLCFLLRGPHALLRHKCCKHTCFSVSLHFGAGRVFFLVTRPPFFNENHLRGSLIQARDNSPSPSPISHSHSHSTPIECMSLGTRAPC